MSNSQSILALLAAGIVATGCAKKEEAPATAAEPATPAVDLAAEEQAIRTRSGEWMNYANAKDVTSIVNGIAATDAVFIDDGKAYRGTAALQALGESQVKEAPDAVVSWTSDEIRVADSGELAVEIGSFNADLDGEGKKPPIQGTFVTTWVKVDGQWRVLSDAGGEAPAAAKP
jgi:ketosteroid isomerase-like protein